MDRKERGKRKIEIKTRTIRRIVRKKIGSGPDIPSTTEKSYRNEEAETAGGGGAAANPRGTKSRITENISLSKIAHTVLRSSLEVTRPLPPFLSQRERERESPRQLL